MTEDSKVKAGAAVRVPPPILAIVTIVTGYVLDRFIPIFSSYDLPTPARYWIGGIVVAASGLILGVWPVIQFRDSGQDITPWTATPEIVVKGPYRFTRNPMYLMMLLVCIGFAILLSDPWILVLTPVCAWLLYRLAIRPEEAYLEQEFGDSYRVYKKRVRRWI